MGNDKKKIIEAWLRLMPYRHLIPGSARKAERQLYLGDMETLLGLLTNEFDAADPDPDA